MRARRNKKNNRNSFFMQISHDSSSCLKPLHEHQRTTIVCVYCFVKLYIWSATNHCCVESYEHIPFFAYCFTILLCPVQKNSFFVGKSNTQMIIKTFSIACNMNDANTQHTEQWTPTDTVETAWHFKKYTALLSAVKTECWNPHCTVFGVRKRGRYREIPRISVKTYKTKYRKLRYKTCKPAINGTLMQKPYPLTFNGTHFCHPILWWLLIVFDSDTDSLTFEHHPMPNIEKVFAIYLLSVHGILTFREQCDGGTEKKWYEIVEKWFS